MNIPLYDKLNMLNKLMKINSSECTLIIIG